MGAARAKRWDRRLLGVISRRAVIEGSAPAKEERDDYDTVAYTGIVPVRVRRRGASCDCSVHVDGSQIVARILDHQAAVDAQDRGNAVVCA